MNYNRRATRPDGLYYRDARKPRGGGRRGRSSSGRTMLYVGLALAVVAAIFYLLR